RPLQAVFGLRRVRERTRLCVAGGSASHQAGLAARVWAPHACVSDSWSTAACVLFGLARLAPVRHWLADPPSVSVTHESLHVERLLRSQKVVGDATEFVGED